MADVPITVVGAGVVGLAVAARLAPRFPDLVLLERHERHGTETSSRNSEVIHAGMYYAPGSWKARLCVEGSRRLYEFCGRHGVSHQALGKLIVAVKQEEIVELERLLERGRINGAQLEMWTGAQARALEPEVPAVAALHSPRTGIVSAHELMDALLHQAVGAGAVFQARAELGGIERADGAYRLRLRTPDGEESFTSERVVNAAGLGSDRVAEMAGIDVDAAGYRLHYCKGSYFSVVPARASVVRRLVYPVPSAVSLGVHALPDLGGRLKFGPDAEYVPREGWDYAVAEGKRAAFAAAVRRIVPSLRDEDLAPDISGMRPKLQAPGQPVRDFMIAEEAARGLPGFVNLIGIESPGLTACLAIAEEVAKVLA